jgi:hypothetical protein
MPDRDGRETPAQGGTPGSGDDRLNRIAWLRFAWRFPLGLNSLP